MDIEFQSADFQKECNNSSLLQRRHGASRAKKIRMRLDDLRAAASLSDMYHLPGRCHELKGDRAGQFSLDLDHPYRLIFEPADNPIPRKPDGGLDLKNIVSVRIIGVDDTHE